MQGWRSPLPMMRGAAWILYALCAMIALQQLLTNSFVISNHPFTSAYQMLDGNASRPYVTRQFLPALARAVTSVTPDPIIASVNSIVEGGFDNEMRLQLKPYLSEKVQRILAARHQQFYSLCVLLLLMYAGLVGYGIMLFLLAKNMFLAQPAIKYAVPFIGLALVLPYLHSRMAFKVYDTAALFFAAAYLLALLKRNGALILLMFVLGAINKESILYLLPVFWLVLRKEWPIKRLWVFITFQLMALFGILLLKHQIYGHLPGDSIYFTYWRTIPEFIRQLSRPGYLAIQTLTAVLLLYAFWQKPYFLRTAMVTIILAFLGYGLFGVPGEYRVFTEAMPAATLAVVHSLFTMIQAGTVRGKDEAAALTT